MKRFIIALIAVCSFISAAAQEKYNFSQIGEGLVWQKVFEIEAVPEDFLSCTVLSDFMLYEGHLKASIYQRTISSDLIGLHDGLFSYGMNFPITAEVTVEIKEGKYRATVEAIRIREEEYDISLESEFLFRGKIRPAFYRYWARILDKWFTKIFTVHASLNDEW